MTSASSSSAWVHSVWTHGVMYAQFAYAFPDQMLFHQGYLFLAPVFAPDLWNLAFLIVLIVKALITSTFSTTFVTRVHALFSSMSIFYLTFLL